MTQPKTRDQRVKELSKMGKLQLARMCETGIRRPDGHLITVEGAYPVRTWTKDEIVSTIVSIEFPRQQETSSDGD